MPAPIQPASVPDDKQKASPNNPPPKDTSQSKNHKQQSHSLLLSDEPPVILPCTVTSHASGNFFDLRPLTKAYPDHTVDYSVRGLDYPANFTINICAPLLLPVDFPDDPTTSLASSNVSALARYEDGSVRSLGQSSTNPKFRGRNLILEYTNGSPCLNPDGSPTDLKSSVLISLKCAHDLDLASAKNQPALMSFVGSPDNCSFFFEARSIHACPAVNQSQSMAPVSIFLIIFLVALVVYIAGSMVLHPSVRTLCCVLCFAFDVFDTICSIYTLLTLIVLDELDSYQGLFKITIFTFEIL